MHPQFYLLPKSKLSGPGAGVKTEVGEEPVRATCSSGAGSEEDGREAGLLCVGGMGWHSSDWRASRCVTRTHLNKMWDGVVQ